MIIGITYLTHKYFMLIIRKTNLNTDKRADRKNSLKSYTQKKNILELQKRHLTQTVQKMWSCGPCL